jgi:hypothetical protein
MTDKPLDEIREAVASKIIVNCGYNTEYPCPHAYPTIGYEKCPHLDEDICMWQKEQADDILAGLDELGVVALANDQNPPPPKVVSIVTGEPVKEG